jgi:hypothetical protein
MVTSVRSTQLRRQRCSVRLKSAQSSAAPLRAVREIGGARRAAMLTQLRIRRARLRGRGIHPSKRLLRRHFPELLGRNAGSWAVVAEDFARWQHQRGGGRPADVLDTEPVVKQPLDEFSTFLARRSVETVKQAQRLEIEVCCHLATLKPAHLILRAVRAQHSFTSALNCSSGICLTGADF